MFLWRSLENYLLTSYREHWCAFMLQDYEKPLFGTCLIGVKNSEEADLKVSQMLCLPVSAGELLQANHAAGVCSLSHE